MEKLTTKKIKEVLFKACKESFESVLQNKEHYYECEEFYKFKALYDVIEELGLEYEFNNYETKGGK